MTAPAGRRLLAPDAAVPERDLLLQPTIDVVPVPAATIEVVRCKYRVGESLRVVYRLDGERLVSVRAGGGRAPRWWMFPDDRRLVDVAGMLRPDPDAPPAAGLGWYRSELVEYAPERSLTVRALDRSGTVVGYAKRYAPGSVDSGALAARYTAVAGHLDAGPGVSSPRPLARADDLVVLEPMMGTVLAELRVDVDRAAAVGAAIAWVHGATPPSATPTFPRLSPARLTGAAAAVERAVPAAAAATRRLLDALRRAHRPPGGCVLLHGDCHPKNALVDGERQRAHEVAEAEGVLAVEEQGASHARISWARSRREGRTASTSGRTRLTARTACSPSRAAATCHRMAASGGGVRTDR